ncbi:ARID DNA-binding domain-containing protein [Tanacetum coccineum]|uniref:ARID DNA-binding domain-containing protein n=1 Tax=Tanacetum coccineum TaxID=301880 RepID=A0ABQ4Y6S7_9ASTR
MEDVSDAVTINVRFSDGKKLAVHVSLRWTVEMLKCLLADKCEIDVDQQRLIYNGRFLKDDHTLITYGLESGNTVHLIRGSVPAASNDPENKTTASSPTTIPPVVSIEERTMSGVASSLFTTLDLNGVGDNGGMLRDQLPDFDQILQQLTQDPNMMMTNPGETLTQSLPNTNPLLNLRMLVVVDKPESKEMASRATSGQSGANRTNAAATHPAGTDRSAPPVEFGFTSDPNSMTGLMQNPDLISQGTLTPVTRELLLFFTASLAKTTSPVIMSRFHSHSNKKPRNLREDPLAWNNKGIIAKNHGWMKYGIEPQKSYIHPMVWGEILIEANGNSPHNPGVYYAPEVTLNILSQEQLEKQGFQVTYDGNRCSLSLMFKDKEIKRFDEDRLRRMHNHYMQEYFESISKEGEGLEQDTINIKGNLYTTKVQSFTDFVAFLNLVKLDDVVSQEWDYFRKRFNMVVKWFFNHYLNRSLPGNIPPIINEFDMVGEIKWLNPKGNGEEIRRCYMNFLEILTSHYKTARAPRQGNMDTMLGPARRDKECHHQGEIGRDGAQWRRPAVLKEKGNIEHFGVQLEDTNEGPEEPIQGHYKGNQNLYAESSSKVKEEYGPSTDNSSDDFTVIT